MDRTFRLSPLQSLVRYSSVILAELSNCLELRTRFRLRFTKFFFLFSLFLLLLFVRFPSLISSDLPWSMLWRKEERKNGRYYSHSYEKAPHDWRRRTTTWLTRKILREIYRIREKWARELRDGKSTDLSILFTNPLPSSSSLPPGSLHRKRKVKKWEECPFVLHVHHTILLYTQLHINCRTYHICIVLYLENLCDACFLIVNIKGVLALMIINFFVGSNFK